jgi:hypothetical protein
MADIPARDPLVDKLIEAFGGWQEDTSSAWAIGPSLNALSGIPIQEAAEIVRKHYLYQVSTKLREMRAAGCEMVWGTDDWAIVTSPWLFPGWDRIDGVRVYPTCPIDWAVFIVPRADLGPCLERHP